MRYRSRHETHAWICSGVLTPASVMELKDDETENASEAHRYSRDNAKQRETGGEVRQD